MISTSGIFQSPSTQDPSATFSITASGSLKILNVTVAGGVIVAGQLVTGIQVPFGATILPYGTSGTTGVGGTGTYAASIYIGTIPSETMTVTLSPVGQAGIGSIWYQTDTNLLFNRNTGNNGWTQIGPVNSANLGLLPRAGGSVSGAITGSTGLMTKDGNTPFVGVPYVNSKKSLAATLADLADLQVILDDQIAALINTSISQVVIPSLTSNMLIIFGTIGVFQVIAGPSGPTLTLPISGLTYGDGTPVKLSECYGMASINALDFTPGFVDLWNLIPQDSQNMSWVCFSFTQPSAVYHSGKINYMIIALKTGA